MSKRVSCISARTPKWSLGAGWPDSAAGQLVMALRTVECLRQAGQHLVDATVMRMLDPSARHVLREPRLSVVQVEPGATVPGELPRVAEVDAVAVDQSAARVIAHRFVIWCSVEVTGKNGGAGCRSSCSSAVMTRTWAHRSASAVNWYEGFAPSNSRSTPIGSGTTAACTRALTALGSRREVALRGSQRLPMAVPHAQDRGRRSSGASERRVPGDSCQCVTHRCTVDLLQRDEVRIQLANTVTQEDVALGVLGVVPDVEREDAQRHAAAQR